MRSKPYVSVGLPVYNGENYLAAAIESILAQTFTDLELIISDNASTDNTPNICQRYACQDPRVRYYRNALNQGAAWNFNRVIELAQGRYFRWVAHDDLCAPTHLERCVEVLDANASVVLCSPQTAVIDEEGKLVLGLGEEDVPYSQYAFQGLTPQQESRRVQYCQDPRPSQRYLGVLMYSVRCYEIFGVMRTDVLRQTGGHRAYRGGEKVLLAELSLRGRFYEIPEVLFFSRWHAQRFSSNLSAIHQQLYMNPQASQWIALPHQVRATRGYSQLIAQVPLTWSQRVSCTLVLLRFVLQLRKWSQILSRIFTGGGNTISLPVHRRSQQKGK
jgi:glycosyltransferase involved in cell wall biosynthesis